MRTFGRVETGHDRAVSLAKSICARLHRGDGHTCLPKTPRVTKWRNRAHKLRNREANLQARADANAAFAAGKSRNSPWAGINNSHNSAPYRPHMNDETHYMLASRGKTRAEEKASAREKAKLAEAA
jgi:hypothetical protein